jgi:hypothetical protein
MSDGNDNGSNLEEAAAQGPLPGAEEADEAARRGEDTSEVKDPQQEADEAGDETVPGGIAMGRG